MLQHKLSKCAGYEQAGIFSDPKSPYVSRETLVLVVVESPSGFRPSRKSGNNIPCCLQVVPRAWIALNGVPRSA